MMGKKEEKAKRIAKEARENSIWYEENLKEIRKEHEGEFIAIKEKEIVVSAESHKELMIKLQEEKIKLEEVLTTFVDSSPRISTPYRL